MPLPDKSFFRVGGVAVYWDVSVRTIRAWIQNGTLPVVRIGGVVRIPRAAVLARCEPITPSDPDTPRTPYQPVGAQSHVDP